MLHPEKLTAAQVMTTDVITVHRDDEMSQAMTVLRDAGIGGAPVVDDAGRCVGVLSLADIARRDLEIEEGEVARAGGYFAFDPVSDDSLNPMLADWDPSVIGRDTVSQWMSDEVYSVSMSTGVRDVCQLMLERGVRRLLVLDGETLKGVVSSIDIVRLIADDC